MKRYIYVCLAINYLNLKDTYEFQINYVIIFFNYYKYFIIVFVWAETQNLEHIFVYKITKNSHE